MNQKETFTPTPLQVTRAIEHIAYEYVMFLAAAKEMGENHAPPVNHLIQEAFLVHARNLMDFFYGGVSEYEKKRKIPLPRRPKEDDIWAVDLLDPDKGVHWDPKQFDQESGLRKAINKTLAHLSYSRILDDDMSAAQPVFNGPNHLHGTVRVFLDAWESFLGLSILAEHRVCLERWLTEKAEQMRLDIGKFWRDFDGMARRLKWTLNEVPGGRVT